MATDLPSSRACFTSKVIAFPGLIISIILSCLLLGLTTSDWYSEGFFYNIIVRNNRRATIQIFVQVVSAILASLQIFALSSLVNHDTRLRIRRRPMTLDALKFRKAIQLHSLDFDLPYRYIATLGFPLVAIHVPVAFWTGPYPRINNS